MRVYVLLVKESGSADDYSVDGVYASLETAMRDAATCYAIGDDGNDMPDPVEWKTDVFRNPHSNMFVDGFLGLTAKAGYYDLYLTANELEDGA